MKIENDEIIISLDEGKIILKEMKLRYPSKDLKNIFLDLNVAVDLISEKIEKENKSYSYAYELKPTPEYFLSGIPEIFLSTTPVPEPEKRYCKCGLLIGRCIVCFPPEVKKE